MGVQFGGLIFYPKSPRYALNHLSLEDLHHYRGKVNKVGVFVDADADYILDTVDKAGLYLVQLHGDETPKFCEKIAEYISVIKAFNIDKNDDILFRIEEYREFVDMFLFDTKGLAAGGNGIKFDWEKLFNLDIGKPFLLSGGIGSEDVSLLAKFAQQPVAKHLLAVDVNSKFETAPGIKNLEDIAQFYEQIKNI